MDKACFGFFNGEVTCTRCFAMKRCRAVVVSNGFEIVASVVEELVRDLPDNGQFYDTDSVKEITDQLLFPLRVAVDCGPEDSSAEWPKRYKELGLLDMLEDKGIQST